MPISIGISMTIKERQRPEKKTDKQLFSLLQYKIANAEYIFKRHARQRQKDRGISDLEVLNILEGKTKYNRRRNKSKDKYEANQQDWNYCIEGKNLNKEKIRIIISFENKTMPIITVMWM